MLADGGSAAAPCGRACTPPMRQRAGRRAAEPGLMRRVQDRASDMVVAAMNFVGVRYRRGGDSAETGFDCSGFTRHVFELSLGLVLPRRADEQARDARPGRRCERDELQPGDLVFFNTMRRTFSHVGIYIGDNRFVHAPRSGKRRAHRDMTFAYWAKRFTGARRAELPATPRPRARSPGRSRRADVDRPRRDRPAGAALRPRTRARAQSADGRKSHPPRRPPLPARPRRAIPATLAAPTGVLLDRAAAAAARPAHLGHRPLQLPLQLLHAEGDLRQALRVPAAVVAAQLRGDRPRWRGCSSPMACARSASPAASRCCAATCERLVAMLAALRTVEGEPLDLTLTTNGSLLARKAEALKRRRPRAASRSASTRSTTPIFRRMNDADFPVADVLAGIDAAERAGLGPLKVNMVVKRGTNDHEIVPMARHFRGRDVALRFIEYMDVGATNGWRMDEVLPSAEVIARLGAAFALEPLAASTRRRDRRALALCRARRRRRDRHDLERHQGLLPRLQPGAPVDRGQALPLPVRQPRPRPARAAARRRQRRRDRRPRSAWSGTAATTATPSCAARAGASAGSGERRVEMHYIGG